MRESAAYDSLSDLDKRRHVLARLINHLVVQLQSGCGNATCTTPTCYSYRARVLPQQPRRYTAVTARAMATELVLLGNVDKHMCPHVLVSDVEHAPAESQRKTDPKSLVQQLFNTKAFRALQLADRVHGTQEEVNDQFTDSVGRSELLESNATSLTCLDLVLIRAELTKPQHRWHENPDLDVSKQSRNLKRLDSVLSSYKNLSSSFQDCSCEVHNTGKKHGLPSSCLDQAFRGWPSDVQISIFDALWFSLSSMLNDSLSLLGENDGQGRTLQTVTQSKAVATVVITTIHALTASIPRADLDTWHLVWSTIVNGRAYGKQRYRRSDVVSSPWLHILDAFESEPALHSAQQLLRAIGARTCLEETVAMSETGPLVNSCSQKLREAIIEHLVEEEKKVRFAKFGSNLRVEKLHGNPLLGTTTLLWLEWLRKCFLKHWDGSLRLSRFTVPGVALELMEDIWKHRSRHALDLPHDVFPTPVIFDNMNIDQAAVDWIDYRDKSDTRHILSFRFLLSARGLALVFRTVNHVFMRRAYCGAGAVQKMRTKALSRASLRDNAYLDQRMKTAQEPYLVLKINRHSVLSDANDQIWHRLKSELSKPLRVRMGIDEGEIGHDLGGVQIEFFKLACAQALDPNYSLFSIDPSTHLAWFQPASMVPLYKYQLFGVLFALAIYNGVTLPVSFPLVLYRKLLSAAYKESDLREGWPDLARSLQDLCDYDGSVEDDLARDFVFSFTANGLYVEVDMKNPWDEMFTNNSPSTSHKIQPGKLKILRMYPDKHHPDRMNGENEHAQAQASDAVEDAPKTPEYDAKAFDWPGWQVEVANPSETPYAVTAANREAYAQEYKHWILDYSIRPQFSAFAKGFYTVLDPKSYQLLTPETLRTLVEGHKKLDVSLLQRAATYRGYDVTSRIVVWFWETIKEYCEDKQKQLLEFVTASSRVPINGAESLTFVIERMPGDTTSLPGSSTCFSTLRLPDYESKAILQSKLDIALQHSLGFGQA